MLNEMDDCKTAINEKKKCYENTFEALFPGKQAITNVSSERAKGRWTQCSTWDAENWLENKSWMTKTEWVITIIPSKLVFIGMQEIILPPAINIKENCKLNWIKATPKWNEIWK